MLQCPNEIFTFTGCQISIKLTNREFCGFLSISPLSHELGMVHIVKEDTVQKITSRKSARKQEGSAIPRGLTHHYRNFIPCNIEIANSVM